MGRPSAGTLWRLSFVQQTGRLQRPDRPGRYEIPDTCVLRDAEIQMITESDGNGHPSSNGASAQAVPLR